MGRYVRCPDCHRMFANRDKLASHVGWQLFGHPKARRQVRKHKAQARKQARRACREREYEQGDEQGLFARSSPSIKSELAAHRRAQA